MSDISTVNISGGFVGEINDGNDGETHVYMTGTAVSGRISASVVTMGEDDGEVSINYPKVEDSVGYPVDGTLYFYDGIISSGRGTGYALQSNPADIPEGYRVHKETINGTKLIIDSIMFILHKDKPY